jgi:hypothetical protein
LRIAETRASIWEEHEALLGAIAAGNAELAQKIALDHCEVAGENLARQLTSLQPPPSSAEPSAPTKGDKHETHPGTTRAV